MYADCQCPARNVPPSKVDASDVTTTVGPLACDRGEVLYAGRFNPPPNPAIGPWLLTQGITNERDGKRKIVKINPNHKLDAREHG